MSVPQAFVDRLREIIIARINRNELELPSFPAVANKCLELLRSNDFSTADAARILETDPFLAASVIRAASGAATRGVNEITSIDSAVTRLGASGLKNILIERSARKVFESRNADIRAASEKVWTHSVAVAILSRDIAAIAEIGEAGHAYLTGLLHDVGKPIVAAMLLEAEAEVNMRGRTNWIGSDSWLQVISDTHRPVGKALATEWGLPTAVRDSIEQCEDFDVADRKSVANVVRFANAVVKGEGIAVGEVDQDANGALIMVGRSLLGIDDDALRGLVASLGTRVEQAA